MPCILLHLLQSHTKCFAHRGWAAAGVHSTAQLLTSVPQPYLFPQLPGKRVCSCGRGWSCGVYELPGSGARNRDNQSVTRQQESGIPGASAQAEEG